MKKRIMVPIIVIGLLLTSFSAMSVNASFGEPQDAESIDFRVVTLGNGDDEYDVYVDDDAPPEWYDETHVKTIREGINNASTGDTVFVYSGTYYEHLTITKTITLIGEDRETTIIDGCSKGRAAIYIDADEVTVNGFTIQNGGRWEGAGITTINSNDSQISNNIIKNNDFGIKNNDFGIEIIRGNVIITDNIIIMNRICGIFIGNRMTSKVSSNNHISNNIISDNLVGIHLELLLFNNVIKNNVLSWNVKDIVNYDSDFYSSDNQFLHNLKTYMLPLDEVNRVKNLYDIVTFDLSMFKPNGDPCYVANYNIYTRPFEPLSISKNGNKITGSFTVTRLGTYSLVAEIKDINNNRAKTKYVFFVDPSGFVKTKYYLRGVEPIHGQPAGSDAKSLLLAPPIEEEYWQCGSWIQNSPDNLTGEYTLSVLDEIDIHSWYKTREEGFIGIERFVTYGRYGVDRVQIVDAAENYTWVNTKFTDLDWSMDYSWSLYFTALRLSGHNPYWMTNPIRPSYADFTFRYTTTPTIKSISNKKVTVLSATSPPGNTNNAHIVLEGTESTNLVVQMPDKSKRYSAKLNDDDCDFTQINGELNFDLCLDSSYSEHLLCIYTSDNRPPEKPTISGPTGGKAGTSYTYTFTVTDSDTDDIAEYIVNWGDGPDETITGPFASGSPATASHIWSVQGTYTIKAKAKDVNGLIGPEGTLSVSMPKNKGSNEDSTDSGLILSRLVERFRGSTDESSDSQQSSSLLGQILQNIFERSPSNTQTPASTPAFPIIRKLLSRLR